MSQFSGYKTRKHCFFNMPSILSWGWFLKTDFCVLLRRFYGVFLKTRGFVVGRVFSQQFPMEGLWLILEWSSIDLLLFIWNLHNSVGYWFMNLAMESFVSSYYHRHINVKLLALGRMHSTVCCVKDSQLWFPSLACLHSEVPKARASLLKWSGFILKMAKDIKAAAQKTNLCSAQM